MTYIIAIAVIIFILHYYLPNNPSSGISEYILHLIMSILVIITLRALRYAN